MKAAVAADELLKRAKQEAKGVENEQTRVIAKFKMPDDAIPEFADEKPTRPGKEKASEAPSIIPRHPGSEPPEPMPEIEVSGMVQKADVLPIMSFPPMPELADPPARRWPRIVLAILTPAAIIVTALAVLRHFGLPF